MLHYLTHSCVVDGHLGWLHNSHTVGNSVINTSSQVTVLGADLASVDCMYRVGIAGSHSNSDFRGF